MPNTLKCSSCKFFDPIRSGKLKKVQYGWCAARSIYPYKEEKGQSFPPGVRRADSAETPATPYIVEGNQILAFCIQVKAK